MLAELAKRYDRVYPLYIRQGLIWERAELRALRRFSSSIPITVLRLPVRDLYGAHWSLSGRNIPGTKSPNATPVFFRHFAAAAGEALGMRLRVIAPLRGLTKEQVIRRGRGLPLHLTFSCINPKRGRACGRCNKCAERRRAFRAAGQ